MGKTMAHGIVEGVDKGVIGYCKEYGGTWHHLKEYQEIDGEVSTAQAREALGYEVAKLPMTLFVPEYLRDKMPQDTQGRMTDMFALCRVDNGLPIHGISVTGDYTIYQNSDFLDEIEKGVLASNPNLAIETCGSLFGGRKAFVSMIVNRFQVKKDHSETLSRLMYTNAFGGLAISACMSTVRVVCNNTHKMAEAQGELNKTLRKFKHTKNAAGQVRAHLVDLTKLQEVVAGHKEALDWMADKTMTEHEVSCFLGNIFPVDHEDDAKRAISRRENKQIKIREIFDTATDLQDDIRHTRYSMFQAVTNFNSHETITKANDAAFVWDNILSGGNRHDLNQQAFDLLIGEDIPTPKGMKLQFAM